MNAKVFRYPNFMALVLLLLVVGGCQRQQTLDVVTPILDKLSVDAAKQYYEAAKDRSKTVNKYKFRWDLVKKIEIDGALMITVPIIDVNGGSTIIQIQNGQVTSSNVETGNAMFYLDGEGKITASLTAMEIALTENLSRKSQKMYFFNWIDESVQSVWTLANGKFLRADRVVGDSRARTSVCTMEQYILKCDGAGQLGGGHQTPGFLPDPGEGCYWQYIGDTGCGGGAPPAPPVEPPPPASPPHPGYPGGGSGGGQNGPPNISQEVMQRIYVAYKVGAWKAQGVNVTDQEFDWLLRSPFALIPLDFFVRDNLAAAKEKLAFGILGNFIRHILSSDFEKRMFDRYWSGTGEDYYLTNAEFYDVISQGTPIAGTRSDQDFLGQPAYEERWDWYNSGAYNFAFGRSAVYIRKSDGMPFGFQDDYDFDVKPWGMRSLPAEVFTRLGASFIRDGAVPFKIKYP